MLINISNFNSVIYNKVVKCGINKIINLQPVKLEIMCVIPLVEQFCDFFFYFDHSILSANICTFTAEDLLTTSKENIHYFFFSSENVRSDRIISNINESTNMTGMDVFHVGVSHTHLTVP